VTEHKGNRLALPEDHERTKGLVPLYGNLCCKSTSPLTFLPDL